MGRDARINKARRKRELEAFLATEEGQAAFAKAKQEQVDAEAAQLAAQVLEGASDKVRRRLMSPLVAAHMERPVTELLRLAEDEVAKPVFSEHERFLRVMRLREVMQEVGRQRAELDKMRTGEGSALHAETVQVVDRSHQMALAEALAAVVVRAVGKWDEVPGEAASSGFESEEASA